MNDNNCYTTDQAVTIQGYYHAMGEWLPMVGVTPEGRVVDNGYRRASGGNVWSDDMLTEPDSSVVDVTWEAGLDDSEEMEVSMPVSQWVELVRKAKAYDRVVAMSLDAPRCVCR